MPIIISMIALKANSKGVSPLIASVLLIAFTMAIAAILTAWISSFTTTQKEKAAASEEKIQCNYGFLENDIDFAQYNQTNGTFTIRLKNTGTIDLGPGKYQTWFGSSGVPTIWKLNNPALFSMAKQTDKLISVNVSNPDDLTGSDSGKRLTKIKFIAHLCENAFTTVSEPIGGWVSGAEASGSSSWANSTMQTS